MKVVVTGAKGFIMGYLVEELLKHGYEVVGIDNLSKYGDVKRSYDSHPKYTFVKGDVKNTDLLKELLADADMIVAGAALIGGIYYFHKYAYDIISENERITASTFDAAIWAFKNRKLKRIVVISSSMVFERASVFPTPEGEQFRCPPPMSTYGFQKLATEYFAKGAWEQYGLPYTIIRPFNAVGIGEFSPEQFEVSPENLKVSLSHVIPDLIVKILKGQDPLRILGDGNQVRCFTYAGDIAVGIRLAMESEKAINEDFNISHPKPWRIIEVAEMIWKKIRPEDPFRWVSEPPFPYDVKKRVPSVEKARRLLGFEAKRDLEEVVDEMIAWFKKHLSEGAL